MKIRAIFLLACLSSFSLSETVYALETYPGCDIPIEKPGAKSFYVDPALGSKSNDGSAAHPWHTLEEVLDPANHLLASGTRDATGHAMVSAANAEAAIKPGDILYLMSGDHGSPNVAGAVNSDFIRVEAAPQQTPIVKSLSIKGSSHWLFRGIKFQSVKPPSAASYTRMVDVRSSEGPGASDNVIFVNNSFSAEDSTSKWTDGDWVNRPYQTALSSEARCTTIVDNHFYNLRDGIGIWGDHSLVQNNLIEDTGNDGIDMATSDVIIRGNRIWRGRHTPAEPLHPDGIQGWTLRGATNRNVVVDANSVINLNPAPDNERQGISIFDGRWDGLVVSNNLVITNHWHGIALYGVTNALVINNTVIPARPDRPTWITIHDSKDKTPSEHVVVRNNISAQLIVGGKDVTMDHNIAQKAIVTSNGNRKDTRVTAGSVGDHNIIDTDIFHSFVDYRPSELIFNLRPASVSPRYTGGDPTIARPHPISRDGPAYRPPISAPTGDSAASD